MLCAAMIVSQSSVNLSSERVALSARQVTETLTIESRRMAAARPEPTSRAEPVKDDEGTGLTPELDLLKLIIERMLGREIRLFRMDQRAVDPGTAGTVLNGARGGPAIEYERIERLAEVERTAFHAEGEVQLEDGRAIAFDVDLVMERTFASESRVAVSTAPARTKDPLMLNLEGGAVRVSDARFRFDVDADGSLESVPLPEGGTVLLAFDRNGNARIDSGAELFGPVTGQGFAELATLDSDGNGWVDGGDEAFASLSLWNPEADGGGTLTGLADAGIGALQVTAIATPFALRNADNETLGLVRSSAVYLTEAGGAGVVQQVDVVA